MDWDTAYEIANDMFDELVFSDHDLLDRYNDREDDDARYTLFAIVNEMTFAGMDGDFERMRSILRQRVHEFMEVMN